MEKLSIIKLLVNYLFDKRKVILMFLLTELIFYMICALYQLENFNKLLYGAYITLFISISYGAWDFRKYVIHISKLNETFINAENLMEIMPLPQDLKEERYQQLIKILDSEIRQLSFRTKLRETEMSDYYTMWAHQVKTPLAAVRLMLQRNNELKSSYAMLEELFKIEQYIEMVLHYLRLESISSDMLLKEYELKDIVNKAVKRNMVLFINSKLSLNLEDFNYKIITDEKWLLFVLEQLISNSIKYTPQGGITVKLEKADFRDYLVIEDTGIGIRAEDLPRIFEKGFTGYNGRLDKKSTGIGLYLCKKILDRLAHKIKVESEVGKGTKVYIDITKSDF